MGMFNFRGEFESTAGGFWRVPGRNFFVKNRFKFKERGYFVQKVCWERQKEPNEGNCSLTNDPPRFAACSPSSKSSPSLVAKKQLNCLCHPCSEMRSISCDFEQEGNSFHQLWIHLQGTRRHMPVFLAWPGWKSGSIYFSFVQKYISYFLLAL